MRIGVDIGGTHIGIGVVDGQNIVESVEANTKDVYVFEFIVEIVNKFMKKYDIDLVGVGYCGVVRNGIIEMSPNLKIDKCNLKQELEKVLKKPVLLRNDAKCAGLAEKAYGEMQQYDDCVLLTLGTGIGGAYFYNGKLVEPKKSSGFEFGHTQIVKNGIQCNCGKVGCFEQYASITALKREVKNVLNITNDINGIELKSIIEKNKEILHITLDEYIINLCIGLSNIISILEPEIIVLGGSFAYYEEIFLDSIRKKFELFQQNSTKIAIASLKNNAGIIGAVLDNR